MSFWHGFFEKGNSSVRKGGFKKVFECDWGDIPHNPVRAEIYMMGLWVSPVYYES
jgi:hypothetical protein